jgi:uncharacterized membrane protein
VERRLRRDDEALRVIALGPSFAGLVSLAFEDLRDAGADKPSVLMRLLWALERVAAATANRQRRAVLAAQAERIADCGRRNLHATHRREAVLARAARLGVALPLCASWTASTPSCADRWEIPYRGPQ